MDRRLFGDFAGDSRGRDCGMPFEIERDMPIHWIGDNSMPFEPSGATYQTAIDLYRQAWRSHKQLVEDLTALISASIEAGQNDVPSASILMAIKRSLETERV